MSMKWKEKKLPNIWKLLKRQEGIFHRSLELQLDYQQVNIYLYDLNVALTVTSFLFWTLSARNSVNHFGNFIIWDKPQAMKPMPENANLMFSLQFFFNFYFPNARIVLYKAKNRLKCKFDNLNLNIFRDTILNFMN